MTLRTAHGTAAEHGALVVVETLPASEQPVGVPDVTGLDVPPEPPAARRADGTFADRSVAAELGRRGGLARARRARQLRALDGLGLHGEPPDVLRPYLDDAEAYAAHEVERLARDDGGGVCPPNASAMVQQAALAMAGSRVSFASGDLVTGARLGAEVRSCLLAARELCVREAETRRAGETARNGGRPPINPRFLRPSPSEGSKS
jgi:hypothetical protein